MRRLARGFSRQRRQVRDLSRASAAAFRGVELSDGLVPFFDENGDLVYKIELDPDGGVVGSPVNTPTPATPTAPDVVGIPGGIEITYDGTFVEGNLPSTFARYEIHASPTTPLYPGDDTQVGSFGSPTGGTHLLPLPGGNSRWIGIVVIDQSGAQSGISDIVLGTAVEEAEASDGEPPEFAPVVRIKPGISTLFLMWDAVVNLDPVTYKVYLGTNATLSDADLLSTTDSTMTVAASLPDGTSLSNAVTYYACVIPEDVDGIGPTSNTVSGSPILVDSVVIAPGAVTEEKLSQGAVTTDKIAPFAVQSGQIAPFAVGVLNFRDRTHRLY